MIGSGFYTGYSPFAPGTIASLAAVGILFIPGFKSFIILIPTIIICFFLGVYLGNYFESIYGTDPPQFTLDEFVGTWIAFIFTPPTLLMTILTIIIWRIFDIYKPFPSNKAEMLKGGYGIMLDDVVSGMYSCIIIYIFKVLFY